MATREHPAYLWLNGEIVPWEQATFHATATAWSGMFSVFEGIRAYWNAEQERMYVFRLREHLRRLEQSIRLSRQPATYAPMQLMDDLPLLLQRNQVREDTYIRVFSFPTERHMASYTDEEVPNLLADTAPYPSFLASDKARSVMVSSYTRISEAVMPPRVKSLANYRNADLASKEAQLGGYDGAIMLNRLGEISEGTWSCVFMVRDGELITPDLHSDVLESVTRQTLIELAREQLGLPVVERRVSRTEMYLADEVFLCGTAAEIQPIGSVDRYVVGDGAIGPVTHRLRALYEQAVRGNLPEYARRWCVPAAVAVEEAV